MRIESRNALEGHKAELEARLQELTGEAECVNVSLEESQATVSALREELSAKQTELMQLSVRYDETQAQFASEKSALEEQLQRASKAYEVLAETHQASEKMWNTESDKLNENIAQLHSELTILRKHTEVRRLLVSAAARADRI